MERETTGMQLNRRRWLSWLPWALALAGLLYLAGLTAWLAGTGLFFPYQLDYGEGFLLHFVREWAQGRPIYKMAEGYPYVMANYPPLTILLALALTPVLGLTYAAGRIWTLLAIAALAALIMAWVRREGGHWLPAVSAALLFVGSPYVYDWSPLFRVDLIGLALTLGGLYAVSRGAARAKGRGRAWFWLAVVLFVGGLYAKQSFIFAPAAALVYLFFFVDRWQAIKLGAALAALGGGLFLLINALTGGAFWYGLVASNVNPFLWDEFVRQQVDFVTTFAILGLLTAWYLADKFLLDRSRSLRAKVTPLDVYVLAALASLWFAGKAGAWENYFFEVLAAFSLCAGLGLARLRRLGTAPYRLLAPLLVLVQVGLMWHTPRVADRFLALTRQSNEAIAPLVARTPDPIASEDMGLLVTHGKVLDYCSFQYSQLARAGRWDQSWELNQLRTEGWSLVILEQGTRLDVDRYQRFTREFLSELDRNYRRARRVGKYVLYEPDPLQHERRAAFGDQLALVGWSLEPAGNVLPGDTMRLTAVWRAQQALDTDYAAFAHLVDRSGQGWAGDDHQPYEGLYPTSTWGAGEMVRDVFTLTVPAGAPPGLYDVQVGWYAPSTQERLPVGGGDAFRAGVLPVAWQAIEPGPISPVGARFGGAIALEGYRLEREPDALHVTLRWRTDEYLDADYSVFVHLVGDEEAQAIAQGDAPPLDGRWPTSLWLPGVPLDDPHRVTLSEGLAPGTYRLLVGLYDPLTGERLPLPDGADALHLAELDLP